jgi:hypothetical protein
MSKVKFVMLSLIAVLAVSALAASSASAKTENKYYETTEKKELVAQPIEGTVGTAQLQSIISNIKIFIICTTNKLSEAEISTEGSSKGEITYSGCTISEIKNGIKTEAKKCKVEIPAFKFKDKLIEGVESGVVEDEFKPASGTLFVEIKIKGEKVAECGLEGTFKTEGSYIASLGDEAEVEKAEGEIVFTSTGSKVKFGKEKTSYTNVVSKVKRTNGKKWYVD